MVTIREDGVLTGMKEICAYMGQSKSTVLRLRRLESLPIRKILGTWYGNRYQIAEWVKTRTRVKGEHD